MKKLLCMLLITAMIFSVCACAAPTEETSPEEASPAEEATTEPAAETAETRRALLERQDGIE